MKETKISRIDKLAEMLGGKVWQNFNKNRVYFELQELPVKLWIEVTEEKANEIFGSDQCATIKNLYEGCRIRSWWTSTNQPPELQTQQRKQAVHWLMGQIKAKELASWEVPTEWNDVRL